MTGIRKTREREAPGAVREEKGVGRTSSSTLPLLSWSDSGRSFPARSPSSTPRHIFSTKKIHQALDFSILFFERSCSKEFCRRRDGDRGSSPRSCTRPGPDSDQFRIPSSFFAVFPPTTSFSTIKSPSFKLPATLSRLFQPQNSASMSAHTLENPEDDRDGIRPYRPSDLKQVQLLVGAGVMEQLTGKFQVYPAGAYVF